MSEWGGGGRFCALISAIAALSVSFGAFAEDAYIESDGTQFMNTGYYPSGKTKIEVDFQLTSVEVTEDCVFGNYGGNDDNFTVLLYANPDKTNFQLAGKDGTWQGVNTKVAIDTARHMVVIDVPKKQGTLYAPGGLVERTVAFNNEWTYNNTAIWPIAFFASCNHASGTSARQGVKAKIYGAKIWESEDEGQTYRLLHDYSPKVKGGIAGFLDSKTGTFLYDTRTTGAGTFAYGGDIEVLDDDPYVESDGTDAINLDVVASPDLKVEIDYAFTDTSTRQVRLLGQDTVSSTPRISVYINGADNIAMNSGDGWAGPNTGIAAKDGERHRIVLDGVAETLAVMTGVTTNWVSTTACTNITCCAKRPLALFGNTNADDGSAFKQYAKAKVYGLKIWAGGALLRDLAPRCIDGTAGFEDLATGRFYTCDGLTASANAPTELSGASREGDAFIESDGSFYSVVNTCYFVKPSTKIEIDYQLASFVNSGIVMGGYGSAAGVSTILWCPSNEKIVMEMHDGNHNDTANNLLSPQTPPDLARHTAVFDGPNRHLTLKGADEAVEAEADFVSSWTLNATANWPVLLFGSANNAYGKSQQRSKVRIYGVKFCEGDNLALELTPAVKGGVAGFVDGNGNFYSGDGLTAGGNVQTVEDDPYVESPEDGCFFDTGYYVTSNTCIFCDFMLSEQHPSPQQFPFEAGAAAAGKSFMRMYGNGSDGTGDFAYALGYVAGNALWQSMGVPYSPKARRQITLDALNCKAKVAVNGHTIREMTTAATSRQPDKSTTTLKIFSNGTGTGNPLKGRLYGFQIYEEGVLVRDYVPICQGGTYALRDKVTGAVLAKASKSKEFTGYTANNDLNDAFFEEPMRAEDAYIESDGTQAINLGYYTTPETRYEIDYQMTEIVGQMRPFGEAGGAFSAELYIQGTATGSGNVAFGAGNTWIVQPSGVASDLERHVAVLDIANRECGYSGKGLYAFDPKTVCSKTATIPMWLFAKGTNADGSFEKRAKMRLYAFRIYEAGTLVHEYLPYKNGDTVGLYDTMTGDVVTSTVSGSNAFTYGGGLGYGKFAGVKTVLTTAPVGTAVKPRNSATLTAFAPGAIRYIWTRNGEVIDGEEGETLAIEWQSPKSAGGPVVYAVTPVFSKKGAEVLGEEASAEVTMDPEGLLIILR